MSQELGGAIINDKIIGIICPHCKERIELNILKSLRDYLFRFKESNEKIRELARDLDIDYIINRILKGG